ncbi:MAG: citrate lyase subunit alpha, partial [Spirochaetota bacterium]
MDLTTNSIGRQIPTAIDGRSFRPFAGAHTTTGNQPGIARRTAGDPSRSGSARGKTTKLLAGWDELLDHMDLHDGATISFHHHLRDGDAIVNEVVGRLAARGLRGLTVAPTALFPVHDRLVPYIESGVIARVEGSMIGAVGVACSRGAMQGLSILRSHGGRQRAVQDGELHIDAAFIAAPCADSFGNANGLYGRSACGPLAYPVPDSLAADQVAVITDGLVPYPCSPNPVSGGNVDWVLEVPSIGDSSRIVS